MPDDTNPPASSGLTIPADVAAKFPELLGLIQESESMNTEERQYWINILPVMTEEQVHNLHDILDNERKQLQAIDAKYAKEIEQIGEPEVAQQTEAERRRKREERQKNESLQKAEEDEKTTQLLDQIQNAG